MDVKACQLFPHFTRRCAQECFRSLLELHIKRHGLAFMRCSSAADEPQEMRCAIAGAGFDTLDVATLAAGSVISMMVMPGGTHKITPTVNGRAQEVSVLVDASSAVELNKQLGILNANRGHKRAFFDFDHEGKIASGWPVEFSWQNQPAPGVYAKVELSEAGAKAIAGKNYRAFSIAAPIKRGNPARIVASEAFNELSLGGLVNDPAFATILPLWAKNAGAQSSDQTNNTHTMTPEQIAALQAKNTELQTEITTLKAKQNRSELEAESLRAKQAELEANQAKIEVAALKAKQAEQETIIKAQRTKDATVAVDDAIARGVIPAQNDTLKAKWQNLCESDPANIELLKGMQGNPALQQERIAAARGEISITSEAIVTVVKAYAAKVDAKERGLLYAKEIRGRMQKPEEFDAVIRAANTLGTVSGTLITQRTLDLLKITFPALSRVSTNFTSQQFDPTAQGARYNQTIATRLVTVPTVGTYHVDNGYVSANAVATDVPVTIDAHKFIQVDFNANEQQSTRRLLFGEQEEAMHYAIGLDLMEAIYALFTAANYTEAATTEAIIDFDRDTVIDVGTAMQIGSAGRNANTGTRTLLLNANAYGALSKDTIIVANQNNSQAAGAIGSGVLPMVHGFLPVEAPNLPATGNLIGMGLRADAVALATALPLDYANQPGLPATALQQVVTNPDTGLSVQLTMFVDHKLGKTYMRLAWMRGQAVGNLKAGQRIISAAP
jgi:hypothetical protein